MQGDVVVRRVLVLLAAVFVVAVLASVPQLASPAAGAAVQTRSGTVVPTTLTVGGQTRFCGDGFARRSDVEIYVGKQATASVTASDRGQFCVEMLAQPGMRAAAAELVAVGEMPGGQQLKVVGKVAIAKAQAASTASIAQVSPLVSAERPLVVRIWLSAAVAAVAAGVLAIMAQRRRNPLPASAE